MAGQTLESPAGRSHIGDCDETGFDGCRGLPGATYQVAGLRPARRGIASDPWQPGGARPDAAGTPPSMVARRGVIPEVGLLCRVDCAGLGDIRCAPPLLSGLRPATLRSRITTRGTRRRPSIGSSGPNGRSEGWSPGAAEHTRAAPRSGNEEGHGRGARLPALIGISHHVLDDCLAITQCKPATKIMHNWPGTHRSAT